MLETFLRLEIIDLYCTLSRSSDLEKSITAGAWQLGQ